MEKRVDIGFAILLPSGSFGSKAISVVADSLIEKRTTAERLVRKLNVRELGWKKEYFDTNPHIDGDLIRYYIAQAIKVDGQIFLLQKVQRPSKA